MRDHLQELSDELGIKHPFYISLRELSDLFGVVGWVKAELKLCMESELLSSDARIRAANAFVRVLALDERLREVGPCVTEHPAFDDGSFRRFMELLAADTEEWVNLFRTSHVDMEILEHRLRELKCKHCGRDPLR